MGERIPNYTWEPSITPILLKQATAEVLTFALTQETSPGSGNYVPYDLTGKTAAFSLQREDPLGSNTFIVELDTVSMTIAAPTSGVMEITLSEALILPAGDHLGELAILDGGVVIARLPRGRTYVRVIVGKALLGP
jgi:hypothetical protein